MQKLIRFFAVALFFVFCISVSSIAEEITLTTYYPAPYGNYEELQATSLAVGSTTTVPTTDGDLEASGTIQANAGFNFNGNPGDTETFTVVTQLERISASANMRVTTRIITVEGGIITDVSNTSTETLQDVFNP